MAKAKESGLPVRTNSTEEQLRINLVRFVGECGYTANQLADLSGISQATLGRYMRGENAISVDALEPLAMVFGRDVGDFFNPDPPPPPKDLNETSPIMPKRRPGVVLDPEEHRILDEALARIGAHRRKKKLAK
jgi:transcriptional regulator with XRE-family HTH domain